MELLVSISVLSLIMLVVFQMMEKTQSVWKSSRSQVIEFKEARVGFETITRRINQASLSTYVDYIKGPNNVPISWQRNSELHFVSGPVAAQVVKLMGTTPANAGMRTTHCVFFQAPTGVTQTVSLSDSTNLKLGEFKNLLNTWGYFVEFGTDVAERPQYITNLPNKPKTRARWRLIEHCQPSEGLQIYDELLRAPTTAASTKLYNWFLNTGEFGVNSLKNYPTSSTSDILDKRTNRVVAENIIALILLPLESQTPQLRTTLAPNYYYDSRAWQNSSFGSQVGSAAIVAKSKHVLPPLIEVTMVAVEEPDMNRFTLSRGIDTAAKASQVDWTSTRFRIASNFDADLTALSNDLNTNKIKHRVFRQVVRLRESKFGL